MAFYRKNGNTWAPEIRALSADVASHVVNIVTNLDETVLGDDTTTSKSVSVSKGQIWLVVLFNGYGSGGSGPTLAIPAANTLLEIDANLTRSTEYDNRKLLVKILQFQQNGTMSATIKTGNDWAGAYFGFFKIAP